MVRKRVPVVKMAASLYTYYGGSVQVSAAERFQRTRQKLKIPSDECVGVILDIFFDSTAKTLVIYREFWYIFRIFLTLFSQLISIFMSLLHTFSMGVKTDARLPGSKRFASIMRSRVLSASCGTRRHIRTITKMGVSRFEHEFVDLFQPRGSAHFFQYGLGLYLS